MNTCLCSSLCAVPVGPCSLTQSDVSSCQQIHQGNVSNVQEAMPEDPDIVLSDVSLPRIVYAVYKSTQSTHDTVDALGRIAQ